MKKSISLFAIVLIAANCSQKKSVEAGDLQCESQTEPIGIDVPAPRFNWQLSDPGHVRGQAQTAYHILAASSPGKLTEAGADVWNSGKIDSPQPFGVECQKSAC
jgi:hypothetical protein